MYEFATIALLGLAVCKLVDLAASEFTVGLSMVDEVRSVLSGLTPEQLATHLIGGLTVAESGNPRKVKIGARNITASAAHPAR